MEPKTIDPDVLQQIADDLADKLAETRTEVCDRWWTDEVINITGYTFVNCRFENCILVFDWPHFELLRCALVETDVMPRRTHERRPG